MKTKEELDTLKEEVETLNKKLSELTEDELAQVAGGAGINVLDDAADQKIIIGPYEFWIASANK